MTAGNQTFNHWTITDSWKTWSCCCNTSEDGIVKPKIFISPGLRRFVKVVLYPSACYPVLCPSLSDQTTTQKRNISYYCQVLMPWSIVVTQSTLYNLYVTCIARTQPHFKKIRDKRKLAKSDITALVASLVYQFHCIFIAVESLDKTISWIHYTTISNLGCDWWPTKEQPSSGINCEKKHVWSLEQLKKHMGSIKLALRDLQRGLRCYLLHVWILKIDGQA